MQDGSRLNVIGKIVGVYGIKGWLRIESFTRPKENILAYGACLLGQDGEWLEIEWLEIKPQGRGLLACLAGITDRDQAMALVGSELAIDRDKLPATEEGEFYWHDLINLQIVNMENEILGVITGLLETGANDVLVVEADKRRRLIPYVQGVYVKNVDVEKGIMRVDWKSDY